MEYEIEKAENFKSPIDSMKMGNDDLVDDLPIIKIEYLAKKDTPKSFKKGLLTIAGEEQVEEFFFVALAAMYIGNICYPEKFDPDDPTPICYSDPGGTKPIGGSAPESVNCSTCGKSEMIWLRTKGEKPPCAKTHVMLGFELNRKFPFIMQFKRRARSSSFRKFRSALDRKVLTAYSGLQVSWCYKCKLSVEPHDTYYLPVLEIIEKLPEKEAKKMCKIYESAAPVFLQAGIREVMDEDSVKQHVPKEEDDLPF